MTSRRWDGKFAAADEYSYSDLAETMKSPAPFYLSSTHSDPSGKQYPHTMKITSVEIPTPGAAKPFEECIHVAMEVGDNINLIPVSHKMSQRTSLIFLLLIAER